MIKNVVVCGTFDELHDGHKYFLTKAKEYGDLLYVAVTADKTVIRNKGKPPLQCQDERVSYIKRERDVDLVLTLPGNDEEDIERIVKVPPHIYCFGHDQKQEASWNQKLEEKLRMEFGPNIKFYTIDANNRIVLSSTRLREVSLV